ncbi:ABC transporter ATP-binding protein [Granulicoccus phenolivorans]|uniref:ABC transporter ATP-binding protein n=1 Tax=Granulicoccus phenolivorans TaxID=266854 RepID=UPI0004095C70|nr:ABC transporter ATP-binding protein [Granulicoccus phenolivorans]
MHEPALLVDSVGLTRGTTRILDGLSLQAGAGEVTAILGPNGAGKTTLIRCCTALLRPDTGSIAVLGDTARDAVESGRVGVMPQSAGAWSGVRPLELLRYLAGLYAHPLDVDQLADLLGLHRFAGTPYRRLSGGQKQAVNLAGALIGRPELVFLDEPTAGMDPHAKHAVWTLIGRLRSSGVSVVLTTHAMDEAAELADRIWIVDHGRARINGTVAELTAEASLEDVFLAHTDAGMNL